MLLESKVHEAMALFEQGRLEESLDKLRTLRRSHNDNGEVQYLTGVVATAAGHFDLAEEAFDLTVQYRGESPQLAYDLGLLAYRQRQFDLANERFTRAVGLEQAFPQAHAMLGATLLALGQRDAAVSSLRMALRYDPDLGAARSNLAACLLAQGQYSEAEEELKQTVRRDPMVGEAFLNLLELWKRRNGLDDGLEFLRSVRQQHPASPEVHAAIGKVFLLNGDEEGAVQHLEQAVAHSTIQLGHSATLAQLLTHLGRPAEALPVIEAAVARQPQNAELNGILGAVYDRLGFRDQAVRLFDRVLVLDPNSTSARSQLIRHRVAEGDLAAAEVLVEELRALAPNDRKADIHLAVIRERQGRTSEAMELLRDLTDHPGYRSEAVANLVGLRVDDPVQADEIIDIGVRFLRDFAKDMNARSLQFALGKALERRKRFDEAFELFTKGNASRPNHFDRDETQASFSRLKNVFRRGFKEKLPQGETPGDGMIFIVGMPRSGTSLTEQVLASHSRVTGGGEFTVIPSMLSLLPAVVGSGQRYPELMTAFDVDAMSDLGAEYLDTVREMAAPADLLTDKLPHNFLNLGLINRILPGAKIIHCRRNPMDCCMSNYATDYFGSHPYAYDQEDLGWYYLRYLDLMQHWRDVGIGMHEVPYEQMVSDLEGTSRAMLDFLGLDWEPQLLDFHKSKRLVSTASFQQVRRPLYTSSVERWRRYEGHLQPLHEILGEVTDAYLDEVFQR